jgi:cytochrome P450
MYRHLIEALRAPDSPPHLIRMLDEVVRRAVLAGARERYSLFRRMVFRRRVMRTLAQALEERRRRAGESPSDLLDIVAQATSHDVSPSVLAELYLGFIFAIAGSVGFTLGWSLYLLGTNPPTDAEPAWVVREALRLWPVAWLLARRPVHTHQIGGLEVTPRDEVLVCPYAVHRHPRYWKDPTSFQPERWAAGGDQNAYIPFGWGPHTCIAASLSLDLVRDALTVLGESYKVEVRPHTTEPCIGPALAPPRFTLGLLPTRTSSAGRR